MKRKADKTVADLEATLRQAVIESGMTRYAVAKGAGLDVAQLLRFVSGERSLTLPAASMLAAFLGLELRPVEKGRGV